MIVAREQSILFAAYPGKNICFGSHTSHNIRTHPSFSSCILVNPDAEYRIADNDFTDGMLSLASPNEIVAATRAHEAGILAYLKA